MEVDTLKEELQKSKEGAEKDRKELGILREKLEKSQSLTNALRKDIVQLQSDGPQISQLKEAAEKNRKELRELNAREKERTKMFAKV